MTRRRFNEEDDKMLAAAYLGGQSSTKLARQYGCEKSAVLNALRRQGVRLRDSGKQRRLEIEARRDEIVALYRAGQSVWAIKRAIGAQHGNPINRILREAGIVIERRPVVGAAHHMWKGGHHISQDGYRRIRLRTSDPFYPMCAPNGYVMEHRLVMAKALGRLLKRHESVHHIDGNRGNNDLANLQMRHGKHGNGVALRCRACGSHDIEAAPLGASPRGE